jgi:hypothetical protein
VGLGLGLRLGQGQSWGWGWAGKEVEENLIGWWVKVGVGDEDVHHPEYGILIFFNTIVFPLRCIIKNVGFLKMFFGVAFVFS